MTRRSRNAQEDLKRAMAAYVEGLGGSAELVEMKVTYLGGYRQAHFRAKVKLPDGNMIELPSLLNFDLSWEDELQTQAAKLGSRASRGALSHE